MDACSDSALRVSCGLERLSGGRRRERLARLPPPLHFSSAGRIAACGSRPARSRLATRLTHVWRASATHTDSMTYRRSAARLPRDTGPRGQAAHSVGSGQLRRFVPASGPRRLRDSLSPRQSAGSGALHGWAQNGAATKLQDNSDHVQTT